MLKLQVTGILTGNDYRKIETQPAGIWSSAPVNNYLHRLANRFPEMQLPMSLERKYYSHK